MTNTSICFVNTSKSWGGGEKWHHTAAIECSKEFSVSAISKPDSKLLESLTDSNVERFEFNITNQSFLNPFKMYQLYKHFRQYQYSTVVLNLPADVKSSGIAAKLAGIKKIVYRRGMPHPIRNTALNRYLFGTVVTDAIVNSDEIGRSIVKNNPDIISPNSIHTIYNGVNLVDFTNIEPLFSKSDKTNQNPALNANPDDLILVSTGRCVSQKNQLMLIDLMLGLKSSGHKAKLYIAGTGPLLPELEAKVQELNLDDDIKLLGFLSDTRPLLASADVFLFPSHYEGSANAIIEAMAMGKPTVCYCVSSMPEMVIDNQTGLLARYEEPDHFLQQTITLIESASLRNELGNNARQLVHDKFNNERIFEQIKTLLG